MKEDIYRLLMKYINIMHKFRRLYINRVQLLGRVEVDLIGSHCKRLKSKKIKKKFN